MSVSILAWIAQFFAVVSFRAVTSTEYRWATVTESRSMGDSSVSVYEGSELVHAGITGEQLRTPSASMMRISCPSIQKKNAAKALVFTIRNRYVFPGCIEQNRRHSAPTCRDTAKTNLERQRRVFIEADRARDGRGVRAADGPKVRRVLREVDERGVGDGLRTTRVGDADELGEEFSMFGVVPVTKDDSELLVVGMGLGFGVDDDRRAQTVDVLALQTRVNGGCSQGSE